MKKQENEVRKIFIKIRMNDEELKQVKKKQQQTTERSLSEYIRNVSMQKPVTVKYRNQSADDFLKQMLDLFHAPMKESNRYFDSVGLSIWNIHE